MHELPDYNKITFPDNPPIPFEVVVPDASFEALDLLKKFLVYQSKKRVSAKEVGDPRKWDNMSPLVRISVFGVSD